MIPTLLKMEVFQPTRLDAAEYRSVINQSGRGMEMDRYIYSNQSGEGIGSFFGNMLRSAIPVISRAIKGAATIAKPHLKNVAKDIIATGSKRAIDKLSGDIIHRVHSTKRPSKQTSKRRKTKWRNL